MNIMYIDCFSGISGNMAIGALLDAGVPFKYLETQIKKLGIKNYKLKAKKVLRNNISSTLFEVIAKEEKKCRNLENIVKIINKSSLSSFVKEKSIDIFNLLGKAEAKVHNKKLSSIHFHEIGAIDSIIDIVGTAICLEKIGAEKIVCSALNLGSGTVKCAHGIFPVPAPATTLLLKGIPTYSDETKQELVTPTGAALVKGLASSFGPMPELKIAEIGCGAGNHNTPHPNLVRIIIGESTDATPEKTLLIETNIDDQNAEIFGHTTETLLQAGALDVFYTPIFMKKGRPAYKVSVICNEEDLQKLSTIIFSETSTFGLRITPHARLTLKREFKTVKTKYGNVRIKIGKWNNKVCSVSPEYEDCKMIAKKKQIPIKTIFKEVEKNI